MPFILRVITILFGGIISFTDPFFSGWVGIVVAAVFIILGLVSLVRGGEMLVGGSSSVARRMNIPPIVVGLTILAFGTSAPELFVNLIASTRGETDLLISNIIGSNISNLLLIGGTAAIIASLPVKKNTLTKEMPLSLIATLILLLLINDTTVGQGIENMLSIPDGVILLLGFGIFLFYIYKLVQHHEIDQGDMEHADQDTTMSPRKSWIFILLGIYGLYVGGDLIVEYASMLAELFGVSKVLIGASIVAVGTSVPELVTSVIAAAKRHTDMAVGNIIGSNIFNILWIGGICSVVKPVPVNTTLNTDIIILLGITVLIRIFVYYNQFKALNRRHGILLVFLYFCYIVFLMWRG